MGTNFYHRTRSGFFGLFGETEERHIGKRSGGWRFSFRGYVEHRDMGMSKTVIIGSWKDWKRVLKRGRIFDEYNKQWPYSEFVDMVEKSNAPGCMNHYDEMLKDCPSYLQNDWKDEDGWSFSAREFC